MLKAIKVRIYPTKSQEEQLNKLLGCSRVVYNKCLDKKITSYKETKSNETLKSLGYYFHNDLLKDTDFVWLQEHNTKVLKQSLIDMLSAYKRFFEVKGSGFPKFKSKSNEQSCRFPLETISKRNIYSNNKITISGFKDLKFRCSQKYTNYLTKYKEGIRSCTLRKVPSGKFYLSILVNSDECITKEVSQNTIGLDVGIKTFVTCSSGEVFDNLKFKQKQQNKLTRLQRQLSKKVKGSNNRNKARIKLATCYEKIKNKQTNYLHQISTRLINENQVICIENLNVVGMLKNHKLSNSIQSLSISTFFNILRYKAEWYGREVIEVGRFYPSSKTCFSCKSVNKDLKLSEREWTCNTCGSELNRDYNASQNIEFEGLRLLCG